MNTKSEKKTKWLNSNPDYRITTSQSKNGLQNLLIFIETEENGENMTLAISLNEKYIQKVFENSKNKKAA